MSYKPRINLCGHLQFQRRRTRVSVLRHLSCFVLQPFVLVCSKRGAMLKILSLFALTLVTCAAQDAPKSIALTINSNVPPDNISKILRKEYPSIGIVKGATKSDYTLEAVETATRSGLHISVDHEFALTLFDHDGNIVISVSDESLSHAMKALCHAIKTFVMVEVVDGLNVTQSTDVRGDTSGGVAAAIVNGTTGRRTHTDTASVYVIFKGEHALLDCYEHATGCATIAPGKYYGERKGDGIWVSYRMPITHKPMRNHYKIAGSW